MVAATQLMDVGGLEAVTLREVGRRAGVSHMAPYKHFTDKEALLAAVAARELEYLGSAMTKIQEHGRPAEATLRLAMHEYVTWALAYPVRFKLVFGVWSTDTGSGELGAAAGTARATLGQIVAAAQRTGQLPPGDTERLAALIQALAHGAVDLALAGHVSAQGKGNAGPHDLVDDLLGHLRASAG